jgi:hypothetical protein
LNLDDLFLTALYIKGSNRCSLVFHQREARTVVLGFATLLSCKGEERGMLEQLAIMAVCGWSVFWITCVFLGYFSTFVASQAENGMKTLTLVHLVVRNSIRALNTSLC